MIYVISCIATFVAVFLKGFQHKNVIGGHLRLVALTSCVTAFFDVLAVTLILKGGWWIAVPSGIGAACGMVVAIKLHDRLLPKK